MLDHRANEIVIVTALMEYLSTEARPCTVVRQNQTAEIPAYPYVSYNVTTPLSEHHGTYSQSEDGSLYKAALQTWSFTVQSDDADESFSLAFKVYDFFTAAGLTVLADNNITVRRVRDVTNRDNLLSIEYEHRNGLDVTFGLLYVIPPENQAGEEVIEEINLQGG